MTLPTEVRARLASRLPGDSVASWWWTALIGLIAAILRLVSLSHPNQIIFDEVYYANEAFSMLEHGSEWDLEKNEPKFVVHPPLGKWLIALGILISRSVRDAIGPLLGITPGQIAEGSAFDWRIASVIAGVTSVIIVVRVGRRLFGSTVLGCTAGLLLALDGMHFVSSRTALLDVFLMVFVLAAFACLVMDRDTRRQRWLWELERGLDPSWQRPRFGFPWWRVAAAVLVGCAFAVKWSALWYILLFLLLLVVWEYGTLRAAGVGEAGRWSGGQLARTVGSVVGFGALAGVTYLASWAGWFADDQATYRHWLRDQGSAEWPIIGPLINLYAYHDAALGFHTSLTEDHQYQSWPWQWLLLGRPVAYYWSDAGPCASDHCAAEVLLLGTPVLWWSFIPAIIAVTWYAMSRRDWRAWTILGGVAMGILPWFWFMLDDRTMFYFYALPSVPFLTLTVAMALGVLVGTPGLPKPPRTSGAAWRPAVVPDRHRRTWGAVAAGLYVAAVAVCFAYFYPIYVGESITYQEWYARMWLGRLWI